MSISTLFTKPWFVASLVFGCFAIITPKILIPMFKQIFGLNEPKVNNEKTFDRRMPPQSVLHKSASSDLPMRNAFPAQQEQGSSSTSRSILVFILPMYAVGIAVYMIYTLFKVYGKKENNKNNKSLDDGLTNIKWDSVNKRFITENDGVENEYSNLDEDYVKFLKNKRRKEAEVNENEKSSDLNNVLNIMKKSLNNINTKLVDAEKKGGPMDDSDLQTLRLQLANTELQMIKILQTIDSMAITSQNEENERKKDDSSSNTNSAVESDDSVEVKQKPRRKINRKKSKNKVNLLKQKKHSTASSESLSLSSLEIQKPKCKRSDSSSLSDSNLINNDNEI